MFKKAAQRGVSEATRCALAYWVAEDPGPIHLVLPDEKAAKAIMRKRILPMIDATPALHALRSPRKRDTGVEAVRFRNDVDLTAAWAGSPQRLASDPVRYAVGDEVDKWPRWSGREASPLALLFARTKTYRPRHKEVLISTPTTPDGPISDAWRHCADRRKWHVACPDCGAEQPLEWGQVRWEGGDPTTAPGDPAERLALAARLEGEPGSVWVECAACDGGRFTDDEKADLLAAGAWRRVDGGAAEAGAWPDARAYHVSDLCDPYAPFSAVAVAYLRALAPNERMEFYNQTLGEAFAAETSALPAALIEGKATHVPEVVPEWATGLLATADTQGDHFWFTVRAWGVGWRSRGLTWGRAEDFEELEALALDASFAVARSDLRVHPNALLIDAMGGTQTRDGSRTHAVYQWAQRRPRVWPTRGIPRTAQARAPIQRTTVSYTAPGEARDPYAQELHQVVVDHYKDLLVALLRDGDRWQEPETAADPTYVRQLIAEVKVKEVSGRGERWVWRTRSTGWPNHLFDCAVLQVAGADMFGLCAPGTPRLVDTAARPDAGKRPRFQTPHGRPYFAHQR